jgi:hypothetical protein
MTNTRNCVAANNAENNRENNNQNANLSSHPPPTLEQVLAMQAQMLLTMQQTMVNLFLMLQTIPPPLRDRLGDFQRTKPSTFSHVVESMNADDWLKFVEKKLQVVQYNNRENVLLVSHQLSDLTANW